MKKLLKPSILLLLLSGMVTIWSCTSDPVDTLPSLDGTWQLVSATSNGTDIPSPTMTVTLNVTDADGNGTFTISNVGNVVAFNGQSTGNYTLSGNTAITFTTGTASNTATISSSPLTGTPTTNWVVSFTANLDQHNDKDATNYVYTFQLQ